MPSLRSRLLVCLMRRQHRWHASPPEGDRDRNTLASILRFRDECERGSRHGRKLPRGITVRPCALDGLSAEWILPAGLGGNGVILYVHGGGYVSGSCCASRLHLARIVAGSHTGALQFEYRLAPEHPFPAALEDTLASYCWLRDQGTAASRIVFVGDSAGGGLCIAALLALRDLSQPLPAAVVAISPWTDLTLSGASHRINAKKGILPPWTWPVFSKYYVGKHDAGSPWISPLKGDLHGLPRLLLLAGGDEVLRDDAIRFADKARDAGSEVTLRVGEGLFHCYPLMAPLFPEASRAMEGICTFIREALR